MPNKNRLVCLLLLVLVSACSAPRNVIVVERKTIDPRIETEKLGGSYIRIVQSGDTLHAIAFGSGLDVNQLASWNNLSDRSKLQIGQRIRLTKPLNFKPSTARQSKKTIAAKPSQVRSPSAVAGKAQTKPKPSTKASTLNPARAWHWPVKGDIISGFSTRQRQQGIDIEAKPGQSVVAAQAGEVVYVGNGLKGYGNLVIIKHDERFLSAYAHNRESFVREGQRVKARATIGSVGLNKQRKSALHFQIRKDGTPVNPLVFLPKH